MCIFSPTVTQIFKWADKNRAFSKFKVIFWGEIATWSFCKWFSLKNTKLEEQLLFRPFSILIIFEQLYLVNSCPIFVVSFENLGDSLKKTKHIGLISAQDWSFSLMPNLLIQFYQNYIPHLRLRKYWGLNFCMKAFIGLKFAISCLCALLINLTQNCRSILRMDSKENNSKVSLSKPEMLPMTKL